MKNFSEYLKDYIEEKELSWQKASRMCGIDRTLLRRYAGGVVLPNDGERVKTIAEGLGMTSSQEEELCNLYFRAKIGDGCYTGLSLIDEIFKGKDWSQNPIAGDKENMDLQWEIPQVQSLKGEDRIYDAIYYLVREAEWIQFRLNSFNQYEKIIEIFASGNLACTIEQIVEINNAEDEKEEIMAFEKLLPLLFCGRDYTIFCTYKRRKDSEIKQTGMNHLLTDKGMLLFNLDVQRGIYTNLEKYWSYYRGMFHKEKNKCSVFGGSKADVSREGQLSLDQYQIENDTSGVILIYNRDNEGRETIRVKGNRKGNYDYWLEEVGLVRLFKRYMKIM